MARRSGGDKTKAQKTKSRASSSTPAKPAMKATTPAAKPVAKAAAAVEPRLSVAAALLRKNAKRVGAA